ncbi:MAG: hypothetical protein PHD82_17575 [Candidatus Riflebacteria bacterium]|nr:hypothetical protein [Candidatus Riflebacteria bacterium]
MLRKTALIVLFTLASLTLHAFDGAAFTGALNELSEGISQTAYTLSERADSAEREAYSAAADRADRAEKHIRDILGTINSNEDFAAAQQTLADYAAAGTLNSHTVSVVEKMLQQRASFISSSSPTASAVSLSTSGSAAAAPQQLLNSRQRRMVMIDVPVVEAVLSLEDTKQNRRLDNLKEIFKRHNCRILSDASNESGDNPLHVFYFSGKKYVVDALLGHFGGDVVMGDLKAVVRITTGGFWSGKKSLDFSISPKAGSSVMGELSWYKSVVERDPAKFLAENNYSELATLGSTENVAGEKKILLKNATAEIWVMSKNGTVRNAIYKSSSDLGDIYVNAR